MNARFTKGGTAGPGRPEGSRNVSTKVLQLVDDDMLEQAKKVLQEALDARNLSAAKFVLKHALGTPRGGKVQLDLPATDTASGVDEAQQVVVQAVADGEVATGDGKTLFDMLETRRKSIASRSAEEREAAREDVHEEARGTEHAPVFGAVAPTGSEPLRLYGPLAPLEDEHELTLSDRVIALEARMRHGRGFEPDGDPVSRDAYG